MPFYQTVLHGQFTFFVATGWVMLWFGAFRGRRPWLAAAGLVLLSFKPPLVLLPLAISCTNGNGQRYDVSLHWSASSPAVS